MRFGIIGLGRMGANIARSDVVVDGGNSHWEDSQRRHAEFAERRIRFLDMGTSGGVWGARHGACFMAGGDPEAYALVAPLLIDLAYDERAVQFVGAPGTGHFVKLVHNAIEFGMVQASSCSSAPASRSTCRRRSTTGTTAR